MPSLDPLKHAEVLLSFGRRKQAVRLLQDAQRLEPSRADLQRKLEELLRPLPPSTLIATVHLLTSWAFLLGPVLVLIPFAPWLRSLAQSLDGLDVGMIGALLLGLVVGGLWVVVAGFAFLHLWFLYLKHVVREHREEVERRLPGFTGVQGLQPYYGNVRKHYFSDGDA